MIKQRLCVYDKESAIVEILESPTFFLKNGEFNSIGKKLFQRAVVKGHMVTFTPDLRDNNMRVNPSSLIDPLPSSLDEIVQGSPPTSTKEKDNAITMGCLIPESVNNRLEAMNNALKNCYPFRAQGHEDNANFIDVCIEESKEIVRFLTAIKKQQF